MREPRDPRHPKASEIAASVVPGRILGCLAVAEKAGAEAAKRRVFPRYQRRCYRLYHHRCYHRESKTLFVALLTASISRKGRQERPKSMSVAKDQSAHGPEASGSSRCYHRNSNHAVFMLFTSVSGGVSVESPCLSAVPTLFNSANGNDNKFPPSFH